MASETISQKLAEQETGNQVEKRLEQIGLQRGGEDQGHCCRWKHVDVRQRRGLEWFCRHGEGLQGQHERVKGEVSELLQQKKKKKKKKKKKRWCSLSEAA